MGAKAVVIGDIRGEHAPEMPVVEDDDMIEHLVAETPDEPLAVGRLPRAVGRNLDLFSTQVLHIPSDLVVGRFRRALITPRSQDL